MGISSDIMHQFVAKEIKAVFSTIDGWNMTQRSLGSGYDTIVTLDRRTAGRRERVRVLATYARCVSPAMLDELKKTETASDGTITRNGFAVLVPAHTDTSAVPSGFQIYTMNSFAFDGNELTWVKKPVRKEEAPKVAA